MKIYKIKATMLQTKEVFYYNDHTNGDLDSLIEYVQSCQKTWGDVAKYEIVCYEMPNLMFSSDSLQIRNLIKKMFDLIVASKDYLPQSLEQDYIEIFNTLTTQKTVYK